MKNQYIWGMFCEVYDTLTSDKHLSAYALEPLELLFKIKKNSIYLFILKTDSEEIFLCSFYLMN